MQAKVLRVIYGPKGSIDPGKFIDISKWNPGNVKAMVDDGRLLLIEDNDQKIKDLEDLVEEQKAQIAVMTKQLMEVDVIYNPKIHISEETKKADGTFKRYPGRKL